MTYTDPGDGPRNATWRKRTVRIGDTIVNSLWDAPAPSVPTDASEAAADGQGITKRAGDRVTILRALAWHHDGLTRDQIAEETGISPNTVRPRIVELVALGFVTDTRLTRLTVTGSTAAVCEVTDKGRTYLAEAR